jgi:hypothetical protein
MSSTAYCFIRGIERVEYPAAKSMMVRHLVQLLYAHVGNDRPDSAEWNADLGMPLLFSLPAIPVRFDIDDWSLAEAMRGGLVTMSTMQGGLEEDGRASVGIFGHIGNKLLISVTADPFVDTLFVRIGGFQRSAAFDDGVFTPFETPAESPGLEPGGTRSRRRKRRPPGTEADRRALARGRQEIARVRQMASEPGVLRDVRPPLLTVRVVPEPLKIGDSDVFEPILTVNKGEKHTDGRDPMVVIARSIRVALGVRMVLALCRLKVELGTRARVKEVLAASAKADVDDLLRIGRRELTNFTGYNSEDELEKVTRYLHAQMRSGNRRAYVRDRETRIAAEHLPISLLAKARRRAQKVMTSFDKAKKCHFDRESRQQIQDAFKDRATDLPLDELIELAMCADIDPSRLWPQYTTEFAGIFALARFVGRVRDGAAATLDPDLFQIMRKALDRDQEKEPGWLTLIQPVLDVVDRCFLRKHLLLAMHLAELESGCVYVPRSTRDVIVVTASFDCLRVSGPVHESEIDPSVPFVSIKEPSCL